MQSGAYKPSSVIVSMLARIFSAVIFTRYAAVDDCNQADVFSLEAEAPAEDILFAHIPVVVQLLMLDAFE
ncbi:hypothetical protein DXG01_013839 [Tephrocybe rancida]|nr:hypothetical protein DXG01_013839 [Tephrocybe rancida]